MTQAASPRPNSRVKVTAAETESAKLWLSGEPEASEILSLRHAEPGTPEGLKAVSIFLSALEDRPPETQAQLEKRLCVHLAVLDNQCYEFTRLAADTKVPKLKTAYAEVALKFQNASRKTVLAINELRNPRKPTQFIKEYVDKKLSVVAPQSSATAPSVPQLHQTELEIFPHGTNEGRQRDIEYECIEARGAIGADS